MPQDTPDIERRIASIASLHEPVRRALYLHVSSQGRPVGRSEAADAVGISRALAAFHLDKLAEEGLLDVQFQRLGGRRGPGAGRPAKLYRRAGEVVELSLPPRSYELAARLFARALDCDGTAGKEPALQRVARQFGKTLGEDARQLAAPAQGQEDLLDAAETLLTAYGFEPRREPDGRIRLRNCPFDVLAQEHRSLVCGMNLALMRGVLEGLDIAGIEAVLDPLPGMCCVAFRCCG